MKYNTRHLMSAILIHRLGSASEAAKKIHLSQSAITLGINNLENELSITLFERSNAGMFATELGKVFLARIERAFEHLDAFANAAFDKDRKKKQALLTRITSRQLNALINLVEAKNHTLAASQLGLTQPTLTKTIKDLEFITEQKLFTRIPIGVEISWKARQLARYASLFFAELEQGQEEVNELKGQLSGSLKIGSLPLARTQIVPNATSELLAQFPESNISIVDGPYTEQLHGLLYGQIDVIVGALRLTKAIDDINQYPLFEDSLSIIASVDHPDASKLKGDLRDLDLTAYQWLVPKQGAPTRTVLENMYRQLGTNRPIKTVECSSMVAIRGMLLKTDCVALLSAKQVAIEVEMGLLAASKSLLGTTRTIGYSLRKNWKPTQMQKRFIELLEEHTSGYNL